MNMKTTTKDQNDFMSGIEQTPVDWDSIDTSRLPDDCDMSKIDWEYENYVKDIPEEISEIQTVVQLTEENIHRKCRIINEGVYNTLKAKFSKLIKIDDDIVYNRVIDSTIKYKNTRCFKDMYSLYRKLNDKDIRKLCYVEIHSMYVGQIRKCISKANKFSKQQRNERIFKMIEDGVKYADIAAAFNMSLASIKKFGQALKHNKEQEKKNS